MNGQGNKNDMQRMLAAALMRGAQGAAFGPVGAATNALGPIAAQMLLSRGRKKPAAGTQAPPVPQGLYGARGPTNMGYLL